jgi:hypothetical protein
MAQPQHFSPDDFTPTKFSTAEQKAAFANQLLAFIASGFPEKKITNAFYERLCNCFGFIAHYVEGAIMRSGTTKTAWEWCSGTRSLRIIPAQICSQKP